VHWESRIQNYMWSTSNVCAGNFHIWAYLVKVEAFLDTSLPHSFLSKFQKHMVKCVGSI
jgi:hypothetical protein